MGVGLLGAGYISDYHLAGLQAAGARIVAIASRNGTSALRQAERYQIASVADDYQALLVRRDIDAVVIATPDRTHAPLAWAAIAAGKAVLLQKPMAATAAEAQQLAQAAKDAGVLLCVSFMHRYFAEVGQARELLAAGAIGEVYTVRQRNATAGADWAAWFYDRQQTGGVVQQLGVHGIDLLRQLCGEIVAVRATTALLKKRRVLNDGTIVVPDNEDTALVTYRFASGALATHEMSYHEAAGTDRFRTEIYGASGTIWLRSERGPLAWCAAPGAWRTPELPAESVGERQHRHFLAMVRGEMPADDSASAGVASLRIVETIYRAAASDRWEEIR